MGNSKHSDRVLFSVYVWLYEKNVKQNTYKSKNDAFIQRHKIKDADIIYESKKTCTLIVYADEEEIAEFKKDTDVCDISFYKMECPRKCTDEVVISQINAIPRMGNYPQGKTIGLISAENIIFSRDTPMTSGLEENGNIKVIYLDTPPSINYHSTIIVSELIGNKVSINGRTYTGIVPNTKIVFIPTYYIHDVYTAIEIMIDEGVRIINYSAGIDTIEYVEFDRQIDRLIKNNNLVFVCASGNSTVVSSPASAKNCIATGNAMTKTSLLEEAPIPYEMYCEDENNCSGYMSIPGLPNKPDISAPGTFIPYITNERTIEYTNIVGTSFASPFTAGLACLLDTDNYLTAKALITMFANERIMSGSNNPPVMNEYTLREKSGAGLIDYNRTIDNINDTTVIVGIYENKIEITVGIEKYDELIVCLSYEIDEEERNLSLELSTDINYYLCNRQGQNLHIIKYKATESKKGTIKVEGTIGTKYSLCYKKMRG